MGRPNRSRAMTFGLLLILVLGLSPVPAAVGGPAAEPARPTSPGHDPPLEEAEPPLVAVAGADADWWSSVQEEIRRSEYFVTWQDETYLADLPAAYQAPNRAHNLRTYFATEGPVVIPRVWPEGVDTPPWRWQGQLVAWGRPGALEAVATATLSTAENRLEYQRGAMLEWYRNDEDGLAQGFSLLAPPQGGRDGAFLQLDLALGGDLAPEVVLEGAEIDFRAPDGSGGLRYGGIHATDAQGQPLPAWLTVEGATLSLLIDDGQAVYPIDIEATLIGLPDWRNFEFSSPHAEGKAGTSVATAGDVNGDGYSDAIVGVPGYDGGQTDEGKVYVFYGSVLGLLPTGPWQKESDETGAQFGRSVATAGDVNGDRYADVVIGAPYFSRVGYPYPEEGGVWVYYGAYGGLTGDGIGPYPGNKVSAHFGASVATAGDVNGDGYADVIVGAPYYNDGHTNAGRVYVYHGSGDGLSNAPNWRAVSGVFNIQLGQSVATAGDVNADGFSDIIVGAPGSTNWRGAAYVWHGSEGGLPGDDNTGTLANAAWSYVGGVDSAEVGFSVSTAGDVNGDGYADILVGAPFYASTPCFGGRVLLYLGSSGGVENTAANTDCGVHAGADFGYSVSTAGDVNGDGYADVLVGSPHFTDDWEYQGQVYVWYGRPTTSGISSIRNWDDAGVGVHHYFGASVATAGDVNGDGYSDILIGAPGVGDNKGRVYGYYGGPDIPNDGAWWTRASNDQDALFGSSVGTAGDVNGDGYADFIVGVPRWDGGKIMQGGIFVYEGSDAGVPNSGYLFHKVSGHDYAEFGASVGTAGDVNGDGYDDIIVGAPNWTGEKEREGGAFVYQGFSGGVVAAPLWSKRSNQTDSRFGASVGTGGDVNGDGYADIVVGAPTWQSGGGERGAVWLYYGSDGGPHSAPDWYTVGDQPNAQYGYAVGTAGDVNGDGYSDAIVGAPYWHDDVVGEGRAWLYLGSGAGLRYDSPWHAEGNNFTARLGHSVGTAGDVDGDGYSDVIVGAPGYGDGGLSLEGKVWVFQGSSVGLEAASSWSKDGGQNGAQYGTSVGTAGDVNGDGYADVIIGAPGWNGDQNNEGGASLYYGSGIGLDTDLAWHGESNQINSFYGAAVGTAGDVNGDGYAEILVGAPNYQRATGPTDEGQVFLYYGNGSRGLSLNPRQFRVGADVPIAHLGRSDSMEGLRIYTKLQTPFGRGRLQQQAEIKPLGLRFDGTHTVWWGYYSDFDPGEDHYMAFGNLSAGTLYHWRVRLRYSPATTPWMPASRWVTMPWNGWNEADFRTAGSRVMLPVILRNYD